MIICVFIFLCSAKGDLTETTSTEFRARLVLLTTVEPDFLFLLSYEWINIFGVDFEVGKLAFVCENFGEFMRIWSLFSGDKLLRYDMVSLYLWKILLGFSFRVLSSLTKYSECGSVSDAFWKDVSVFSIGSRKALFENEK